MMKYVLLNIAQKVVQLETSLKLVRVKLVFIIEINRLFIVFQQKL